MALTTGSVYDNSWVSHPIPQSDFQYSWITASVLYEDPAGDIHTRQSPYAYSASVFGHAPPSGLVSSSVSGVVPAYNFVSSSEDGLADLNPSASFAGYGIIVVDGLVSGENLLSASYPSGYVSDLGSLGDTEVETAPKVSSLLSLQRNGPYGYPSWKQIRTGEHPIARLHRRNNILSVQDLPKTISDPTTSPMDPGVQPARAATFTQYKEPAVVSKYQPIRVDLKDLQDTAPPTDSPQGIGIRPPLAISYTYGNSKNKFSNKNLNTRLNLRENGRTMHDEIFDTYAETENPDYELLKLRYRESVYPRSTNTFSSGTRSRPTFDHGSWRTLRTDRKEAGVANSMGKTVASQSIWPLDARNNFAAAHLNLTGTAGASGEAEAALQWVPHTGSGAGELQNRYTLFHSGTSLGTITPNYRSVKFNKRAYMTASLAHSVDVLGVNYLSSSVISLWVKAEVGYAFGKHSMNSASIISRGLNDEDSNESHAMAFDLRLQRDEGLFANVGNMRGMGSVSRNWGASTMVASELQHTATLIDDAWHHVALAWYYTSATEHSMSLYIDGVRVTSGSTGTGSAPDTGGGSAILIGINPPRQSQAPNERVRHQSSFSGYIDEVSFFSGSIYGTRSGQEQWNDSVIEALYNYGNPTDVVADAPLSSSHAGLCHLLSHYRMGEYKSATSEDTQELSNSYGGSNVHGVYAGGGHAHNYIQDTTATGVSVMTGNLSASVSVRTQQGFTADGMGVVRDAAYNAAAGNANIYGPLYARQVPEREVDGTPAGYFAGDTLWEAAAQSGKSPFYNSYEDYREQIRGLYKDYTIVPEFRISEHMDLYLNQKEGNFLSRNPDWLMLTGALTNKTSSADTDFFKTYSTSDFMKYFDVLKREHDEKGFKATELSLRCNAVMKFVPYEGFYPVERTVQLANLFSSSYASQLNYKDPAVTVSSEGIGTQVSFRTFLTPLFAPGVLFNSIKSGIAVDHPIMTASFTTASVNEYDNFVTADRISSNFGYRVPFEALVEPENYLGGATIVDYECHFSATMNSTASWDGTGDPLYKAAMQNFVAEVPRFFLKNEGVSGLVSAKDNEVTLTQFTADKDKEYRMRVVLRSGRAARRRQLDLNAPRDNSKKQPTSYTGSFFTQPSITMYSRRSAFGPPVSASFIKYGESYEPFTPPYMDGYADVEFNFKPNESRPYYIEEIVSQITSSYFRVGEQYFTGAVGLGDIPGQTTAFLNQMQVSASLNLLSVVKAKQGTYDPITGETISVSDDALAPSIAIIQPKWETPILDFTNASVTLPEYGSGSIARGMWHQYGVEPSAQNGVFLEIQDLTREERRGDAGANAPRTTGSLADLMGFSKEAAKLGQVAGERVVREAIVAIPYRERRGGRKDFFEIPKRTINAGKRVLQGLNTRRPPGDSILNMMDAMKRYVFPPKFDFLTNPTVGAVSMYIFEFEHVLQKQDLIDIWQNLSPEIGRTFVDKTVTIEHEILAKELMGDKFRNKLRWMVFKVKQKAADNYFQMLNESVEEEGFKFESVRKRGGVRRRNRSAYDYSYNWPYDFFSLVEMVKMEADVGIEGAPPPPPFVVPMTPLETPPPEETAILPDTSTLEAEDTEEMLTETPRPEIEPPGGGGNGGGQGGPGSWGQF